MLSRGMGQLSNRSSWTHCTLLVLLAASHSGAALRCWNCNSDTDRACVDPFTKEDMYMDLCDAAEYHQRVKHTDEPFCIKYNIKVNEVETYMNRGCVWLSNGSPGSCRNVTPLPSHSQLLFCEYCRGDGCNTGALAGVPAVLSGLLAALLLLL